MDLMQLLQGQLSEGLVKQLSQQIGAQPEQTSAAANGILSSLLGGLSNNVATEGGANALAGALDRDHDGSILNDLMGMLTGGGQAQNPQATNGAGMISHILGDKAGNIANLIGGMSGLNSGQAGNLMQILAPMVMSTLGQAKQQNGLDAGGITSLITNALGGGGQAQQQNANPMLNIVSQFLDKDHDGSISDDLMSQGMSLLTGFMKR
ncbi:MAG: hypothetical protein RLZZ292_3203 [Bacteroidota bacterium]|jgi:hypothetical protein